MVLIKKTDDDALPLRPAKGATGGVAFTLQPVSTTSGPGLLASIQPPLQPQDASTHHVPCDIVLVIDVSGSMGAAAPAPGAAADESTGLSVLDVVRHAALTIVETLDERDRLGIVTFASGVDVLQELEVMTEARKDEARTKLKGMMPTTATNMWHGITTGLKLFDKTKGDGQGKVPAMMVLTDGEPNHMCPPQGYVPKMRPMMPFPCSIHTFGFGYHLRSGLLKSIAEIGGGSYAFIPDSGMIGTVFVHAVANLQSTFATDATLTLTYAAPLEVSETTGHSVIQQKPQHVEQDGVAVQQLKVPLGNIQYGQSRDVLLKLDSLKSVADLRASGLTKLSSVSAELNYRPASTCQPKFNPAQQTTTTSTDVFALQTASAPFVAYHESRSLLCSYLSSLSPVDDKEEHQAISSPGDSAIRLASLIQTIPARNHPSDPLNASLIEDLCGKDPKGQISIAINDFSQFQRWGCHFLPSLLNAHARQACNSFKDPGPLQYGKDSPLFIACRDRLDNAFDTLPPPQPTARSYGWGTASSVSSSYTPLTSMRQWRDVSAPCFASSTLVQLASGRLVEMKRLRRGMKVRTPLGSRKVAAVLKTPVRDASLCRLGSVLVTPWHPMSRDGASWSFPAEMTKKTVRYTGAVYSVMLQRDANPDAHALCFEGGAWGVTLGHGILAQEDGGDEDVRAHAFLGNYALVAKALAQIGIDSKGVALGAGVKRDSYSGLIDGFEKGRVDVVREMPAGMTAKQILRA